MYPAQRLQKPSCTFIMMSQDEQRQRVNTKVLKPLIKGLTKKVMEPVMAGMGANGDMHILVMKIYPAQGMSLYATVAKVPAVSTQQSEIVPHYRADLFTTASTNF